MEEKQSPLVKSALTYGVYLGLVSILISVIIWAGGLIESMGIFGGLIVAILSFVISFILILVFAKSYRNKEFSGYISFGNIFKFTMLVVVFSTVITLIYNYIFHTMIAPEYMQELMPVMQEKTMAFLENKGATEAQIDQALEKFEKIPTVAKSLRQSALGGIIGGGIIALIVSAIVKKNEDTGLIA